MLAGFFMPTGFAAHLTFFRDVYAVYIHSSQNPSTLNDEHRAPVTDNAPCRLPEARLRVLSGSHF